MENIIRLYPFQNDLRESCTDNTILVKELEEVPVILTVEVVVGQGSAGRIG